ncbi:MAG: TonB-dependent receptor domain-containing protein [Terriglobales bacterium]
MESTRAHGTRFLLAATAGLFLFSSLAAFAERNSLSGRVLDASGAAVNTATVVLEHGETGVRRPATVADDGSFEFGDVPTGEYMVTATAKGFAAQTVRMKVTGKSSVDLVLSPGTFTQHITVVGTELVSNEETARRIPGSVEVIDRSTLNTSRVFNFSEALRKAAINVRDEEGFGLRPNIGLRGLNPTRSSKVLLLEDGVPLAYAPYGDNASYYHPPVERFAAIEVLKGSGQIQYGPSTIGGVINYITPQPPASFSGSVTLYGGNRDYFNGQMDAGGTWRNVGLLFNYMRKQGEGAREHINSRLNDFNFKATAPLGSRQTLTFKANQYNEVSNVTYSGLTLAEYTADPRQNPFKNDFFYGRRWGASLHHTLAVSSRVLLVTTAYGSRFSRDWWRQSSNSAQRPNDKADPACGGMQNLNTTCGNEGRVREYTTWGVEPRLRIATRFGRVQNETDIGVRAHFENQDREQQNGAFPTARTGVLMEDNVRTNDAYSAFLQNKFTIGRLIVTPGVRIERVFFERFNKLANQGAGVSGRTDLTEAVPGLGVSYIANDKLTVFAGVHRGFAPPRTEDIISNTGGVVDLSPELSWNYEVGFRSRPARALRLDATYFRMDYENQIVPASLAGGVGAALTNGGETLHQGAELSSRVDTDKLINTKHNFYLRTAYTYLPTAKFTGTRFSNIPGFSSVLITGNRLPYAPEHLLNLGFGYSHPFGVNVLFEAVHVTRQFGDDLNTVASNADGQRGVIPGNTTWNAAFNYAVEQWHSTFFVTVKNLLDDTFLVDRSRGMLPNSPRLVQGGVKFTF